MLRSLLFLTVFSGTLIALTSNRVGAEDFVFHHEHILGTSLEIQVTADSQTTAKQAEQRILIEIARQAKIFSSYDVTSELSRWQLTKQQPQRVSPELFAVMEASAQWHRLSNGALNPATEAISQVWQQAAARNQLPPSAELAAAVQLASETHWRLNAEEQTAARISNSPLSFNAIAKGFIVEAACNAAIGDAKSIRSLIVNLGGDLRICGDQVKPVAIADPTNAAENATPLTTIFVRNQAIATSGNYRRGFKIGDQWFSHIIDPRNGRPVEQIISATVVAKSSATADALATICNVLPPAASLPLVESQGAACLLIAKDGEQFASAGWKGLTRPQLVRFVAVQDEAAKTDQVAANNAASELLELKVKIELSRPAGAQYRRPYVAVWLEDADDFPVRTGLLFMMTKQPGPRWHRELNRWYRQDNVRKLADDTDLISTISSASRGPGEYEAVFDGKDDNGKPLKAGKYTLLIEVAREHGTYQIIRQPLELGAKPIETTSLKSNVEIKSASYEYRKPVEKTPAK